MTVNVELPRSVLAAAGVRESELDGLLRTALAVELYRSGRISLGKAADVMGLPTQWDMLSVLAAHDLWIDHTLDDARLDAAEVVRIATA